MKMPRKSIKKRLKEMREPILEQMAIEQDFQSKLRLTMVTTEDMEEFERSQLLFEESVKHWKVLKDSLEEYDKLSKKNFRVSPDTLAVVFGNLAGILLILNFERLDIVRSKAMGLLLKGKL